MNDLDTLRAAVSGVKGVDLYERKGRNPYWRIRFHWQKKPFEEFPRMDVSIRNLSLVIGLKVQVDDLLKCKALTWDRYFELFPDSPKKKEFEKTKRTQDIVPLTLELGTAAIEERAAYKKWSMGTLSSALKIFKNQILPSFEERDLASLSRENVEDWLYTSGLRGKTKLNRVGIFKHIFDYCRRKELTKNNPFEDITLENDTRDGLAAPWGFDEEKSIVEADVPRKGNAKKEQSIYSNCFFEKLAFQFCISMGLREGEVCALAWEDINLNTLSIDINRNHDSANYCDLKNSLTKSSNSFRRQLKLLDEPFQAVNILRYLHDITGHLEPVEIQRWYKDEQRWETESVRFVFLNSNTGGPLSPTVVARRLKDICMHVGVPYRSFKQCRHTFCSRNLTAGNDPEDIMLYSGHGDYRVFKKHYTKFMVDLKRPEIHLQNSMDRLIKDDRARRRQEIGMGVV